MLSPDQYELLDFGGGRRLECFGDVTLDRPCPAAQDISPAHEAAWHAADARFDGEKGTGPICRNGPEGASHKLDLSPFPGTWTFRRKLPEAWTIRHGPLVLELKPTVFGQLGLFPEQAENWNWVARRLSQFSPDQDGTVPFVAEPLRPEPLRVLNLFAYTGGSTLAAAAAGAEVTHVDAARNMVAWARRNAELSGLAGAPIHWIVEDAQKFVRREVRRGNRYDAVILDPPSYGHGAHGEVWRLSKHLGRLLAACGQLTASRRQFMLLTCHTPGYPPSRLREMMAEALGPAGSLTAGPLVLRTANGRELSCGAAVRWEGLGS